MNEQLETTQADETQTTDVAAVTPPPIVNDPWSSLSADEKLEREAAYRQMRDLKQMPQAPPPTRKARTDEEIDEMDIPTVYRAAKDDAREEIMSEMEAKFGPVFNDLYETSAMVSMNMLTEGMDAQAAKILREQLKNEPPNAIKRIAQDSNAAKILRNSAMYEASQLPKPATAPGNDRGMVGTRSVSGIADSEIQGRIAHMKRYGIEITRQEAIEDLKEINGGGD